MEKDTFRTIEKPDSPALFKDRGSKFYAYAFPVESEQEVKFFLNLLREEHHSARHCCYAWRIGAENPAYRANDDGEPSGSAGVPIYNQILSFDLTDVLVAVVRYFGGTLLGVQGLVNAYKTATRMILEECVIVEKLIEDVFILHFDYTDISAVMRVVKDLGATIREQDMRESCRIKISIRRSLREKFTENCRDLHRVRISDV